MYDETIKKIMDLKARLDSDREYDQEIAEDIVNEVIGYMIGIYEDDYYRKIPEEDMETINVYAYYQRKPTWEDKEGFSMIINGECYANRPDDTCARNFAMLESIATNEGIKIRPLTKSELLGACGGFAIGGYVFSINRSDLEKVIEHPNVLLKKKTIPKSLPSIKNR